MTALQDKIKELQLRRLRAQQAALRSTGEVPSKKKSKPLPYKMQNTFKENLKGVPGGHWLAQASAPKTGTKVRKEEIGLLRSATNCNTTQGSYVTTVVREGSTVVSDVQGRKVFGR